MKIVFMFFVFLYSLSTAAETRFNDGSYYNDDYLNEEDMLQNTESVKGPSDTYVPGDEEFPKQEVESVKPKAKKVTKRKPAGGFKEVRSGGKVSGFKEIESEYDYEQEISNHSLGGN